MPRMEEHLRFAVLALPLRCGQTREEKEWKSYLEWLSRDVWVGILMCVLNVTKHGSFSALVRFTLNLFRTKSSTKERLEKYLRGRRSNSSWKINRWRSTDISINFEVKVSSLLSPERKCSPCDWHKDESFNCKRCMGWGYLTCMNHDWNFSFAVCMAAHSERQTGCQRVCVLRIDESHVSHA